MDLATISVTGFRRFKTKTTLQTNGKLVAILGPNEAGKSSMLRAIEMLEDDKPPVERDFCRATEKSAFEIEARFYLSAEDVKAAGLTGAYWFYLTKTADGLRRYRLSPPAPKRDRSQRDALADSIKLLFSNKRFLMKIAGADVEEFMTVKRSEVESVLHSKSEDLNESQISTIVTFLSEANPYIEEKMASAIRSIPSIGSSLVAHESAPNPRRQAINVLSGRVPQIVIFGENERNLLPDYDLAQISTPIPIALDNLFDLAGVSAKEFVAVLREGDQAKIATWDARVNSGLEKNFRAYWKQSKIKVSIKGLIDRILVHVVNEDVEFTSFAERSDGLRQFVALIAFASGAWSDTPIMLIDEAEQRLHYDAQADLVQMLGRQQIASKIIYTTHSAGCLPEDLGNGVHLIHPVKGDDAFSKINNTFWDDSAPGFTSLLFGMGASTMAFFPTRHAVMVEGPSDMLLLPTMMRRALGVGVLGFQIVPGLSYTDGFVQSPAIGKSGGVLYLVDGDAGGDKIRTQLTELKILKKDIFNLSNSDKSAVEVEDFLNPSLLTSGLNSILKKFHKSEGLISEVDLPSECRMAWVENYYKTLFKKKISKIALSYEILDLINEAPEQNPVDPKRLAPFKAIAKQIQSRFAAMANESGEKN